MSTDAPSGRSPGSEPAAAEPPQRDRQAHRPTLGLLLPAVVIVAVVGGLTLLLIGGSSKPALPGNATSAKTGGFDGSTLSPVLPAPPLDSLRNYDGSSFDLAADRGKAAFVTFLYSHCPDVCPLIATHLHTAYGLMPAALRQRVAMVAVSVDPRGDTPSNVAAFVREHGLTGEASYLIGSARQLVPVWKAWHVGSEADASRPELVNHSALIYGISASGKLTTIYAANALPSEIAHDVPALLSS